jgi:FMN phosphatase YigB (HAD superfamily)
MLVFRRMREELRSADSDGEPLVHRQYTAVSKRLNCPTADVEQAVDEWIQRRPLKWLRFCRRSGIDELLLFLRARDVRCGVFSDYPATDKLAALGLADRFDLMMSAVDEEVGAFKPDPQGFRVASARWGIPTEHILYVGDRFDVDAVGAASAGMPCAVLTSRRGPGDAAFIAVSCFQELQRVLDPVC